MVNQKLEPAFAFDNNESSKALYHGKAEIQINNKEYQTDVEVRLDLLPRAGIYIYGEIQDVLQMGNMPATISIGGHKAEGFFANISLKVGTKTSSSFKWRPKSEPIIINGDESTQMTRVVFHLFNFVDFLGTRSTSDQDETTRHLINHVDLICDEWNIEVKSLCSTRPNFDLLKKEGGYQLTHIGSIQKSDGTQFSGNDARECLTALRFFLSFAKGAWCEPVCPVGFDKSGTRIWESWSSPRENQHNPSAWFDPHNGSQLASLFPGFMRRWAKEDWRKTLQEVIYWYLNANQSSRGIDAGIILTQAAIERLSYELAVKERRLVTAEGFKNLWASDKFRLLFSSLNIPLNVPKETQNLQKYTKQTDWRDAPHALTEIRNALVHPEHKKRGQLRSVYYEAWNLGLWYLEMSLLAVCDYSGTYGNRLKDQRWVGQVDNVPWV